MKYEMPTVEVIRFDGHEVFMIWSAEQGVNRDNVMDFLATQGVSPENIMGGGVDALQINPSTHTVICNTYSECYGHQFTW